MYVTRREIKNQYEIICYTLLMKNYTPDIGLVSPLHDPEARLAKAIRTYGKNLKTIYFGAIIVKVTKNTHEDTLKALTSANISFSQRTTKGNYVAMGKTYKEAIALGLKLKTRHIHVCDFDRILHWVKVFPNELKDIVEILPSNTGITFIGRSKRAFETHPKTQKQTEEIVNILASEVAGINVDIMSGSFAMDNQSAKIILKKSKRNDYSFFAEFLSIAKKAGIQINTLMTEGLEWETPDQYTDKIRKEGYSDWLDEFMSLPEWKRRIELMEKNTEVLISS